MVPCSRSRDMWSIWGLWQAVLKSSNRPWTDSDSSNLFQPLLDNYTGEMAITEICRDDRTVVSLRSTPQPTVIWLPRITMCLGTFCISWIKEIGSDLVDERLLASDFSKLNPCCINTLFVYFIPIQIRVD